MTNSAGAPTSTFRIKTLAELREADPRTLPWGPGGLGVGMRLSEESAAEYQQQLMARIELAEDVADGTRRSFDTLRTVWAYGLFCYDIFTLIGDQCLLVIEHALRDRFMELHAGEVIFVETKTSTQHRLAVTSYLDVMDLLKQARGKYRLHMGPRVAPITFNGMLDGLRRWAHAAGLLRGQRNRIVEQALVELRNSVAHPGGYHLTGPHDASGKLADVAEIINQLWGHRTPGGRLYPEPITRDVVVLAWHPDSPTQVATRAKNLLLDDQDPPGWQYMIIRAYFDETSYRSDPELHHFDARHEVTRWPAEWLWGPGDRAAATAWFAEHLPQPDQADHLDRDLLVRYTDRRLYRPMRPEIAAGLDPAEQTGTWYLVRADNPDNAFHHVRSLLTGAPCDEKEICGGCRAIPVASGPFATVMAACPTVATVRIPDVATPRAGVRYRELELPVI